MRSILLIILLTQSLHCYAQYTSDDIFRDAPLTWLGMDFTRVRIEGYNYLDQQFKEVNFIGWNEMARAGDDQLDLPRYLHRDRVNVFIDEANRINLAITRNLRTSSSLTRDSILQSLSQYNLPDKEGIGVIMFVGEIIHRGEHLRGKMAFVDMKTKELLLLKNFYGNGSGTGFHNTWGNAFKSALKRVKRNWDDWERDFAE